MRLILSLVTAVGVVSGTAYATGCGQAVIARGHANYSANYQANVYATPIIAAIVTPYVPTVTAALTAPVVATPALTAPVAAVQAPQCNCPQAVVAQNYASPVVAAVVSQGYGYGAAVVAPVIVHRRHNVVVRPIRANVVRQKVVVRRGLFRRR